MCCGMSERTKEKADAVMDEISSDGISLAFVLRLFFFYVFKLIPDGRGVKEVWQRNHQKKAKNCIEI